MPRYNWSQYDHLLGTMSDAQLGTIIPPSGAAIRLRRNNLGILSHRAQIVTQRCEKLAQGFAWCIRCEDFLPVEQFYKNPHLHWGYNLYCKTCFKELYHNCKAKKHDLVEMAGGKCQRCGYNEFDAGLAFHHVDPSQKDNEIGHYLKWSFERAHAEADKCILLCHNCHKAHHLGCWDATFVKRSMLGWAIEKNSEQ